MNKKIVVDSSPLIAFGRINKIDIISHLAGQIIIPQAVTEECLMDKTRPGAQAIQEAINENRILIQNHLESLTQPILLSLLDKGETEAIMLSQQLNVPLLIDEKIGRQVARKNGCQIVGTGGILIAAKRSNVIEKVAPFIKLLQKNGYYLSSSLISEILSKVDEKP